MGGASSSTENFEPVFREKNDGKRTTEVHQFRAHGDTTIQAVYTNEMSTVESILDIYLEWLKEERYRFVGLDLEYDFRQEKLWCQDNIYPLRQFLKNKDVTFVGYGNRAGMATMASELIHPKYAGMKEKFVTDYDKFEGHNYWEWKPLSDMNLEYASIDGYVAYELSRIVTIVN
ncbi:uncharacterized protein [Lolium perenne]|uniref:uncharacterized protein n=1 Tax=Lolium perenne TaxID=4522 RepID=UPI003A9983A3